MTDPRPLPGAAIPPLDTDDDDIVASAADLPDDVPNDDLTANEPPAAAGNVADTDVDAPVVGTTFVDDDLDS